MAVAQVVASVIWDARDMLDVRMFVNAVLESGGHFEIRSVRSSGHPRGGPAAKVESLRIIGRNDDCDTEHPPSTLYNSEMVSLEYNEVQE